MKVSACIIAKDEENNIERCIKSFKRAVDEVVLLDTGSTDNTVKIAKKLGAKIFTYKWDNNFSNARNFAIEKAHGDWIIFLDADEYFYYPLTKDFKDLLKKYEKRLDILAIAFKHVNIDSNSAQKSEEQYLIRMFRNIKSLRYRNAIHECIANNDGELVTDTFKHEKLVIYHTGYSKDILISKVKRNMGLLLKEIGTNLENAMTYFYLSDCYLNLKQYSNCIYYAKKFLLTGQKTIGFDIKPYLNIINSMILLNKNFYEIDYEINKALDRFPYHPELYNLKAKLYLDNLMYHNALEYYKLSLRLQEEYNDIQINNMNAQYESIYYNIAKINLLKNDIATALEFFAKTLSFNHYNENAFKYILRIVKNEKPEDIIVLINSIYNINSKSDMEFIVRNLASYKFGLVLAYYVNIWTNNYMVEDSSIMFNLLANKNYNIAFEYFYKCYIEQFEDWTEFYTVVSSMLSESKDNYIKVIDSCNYSFKRIILNYFGDKVNLYEEDINEYLEILVEFILMGSFDQLTRYIKIGNDFNVDISEKIGDILSKYGLIKLAIEQYKYSFEHNTNNKSTLMKIGINFYMSNEFEKSLIFIEKAIKNGYRLNDVLEYLHWITMFAKDPSIIDSSKKLTNLFNEYIQNCNKLDTSEPKNNIKRLLIYGERNVVTLIGEIINKDLCEIVAYIDDGSMDDDAFFDKTIVHISEIKNLDYDYIINCGNYKNIIDNGISDNKIIDFKRWIDDFFDYEFYKNFFKEHNFNEIQGIISGISYHEVGIDVNYLKYKFVNFAISGEDLYYNYLRIKEILLNKSMENLKYCIIGLTPYSFQYDLSLTENEFGKRRPNLYFSFYRDYHNYKNKNIAIEFNDSFEMKMNKICIKNFKKVIMKFYRYDYERKWNMMVKAKFESTKMSSDTLNYELSRIKDEGNKNYPVTVNENYNILINYIEMLNYYNIEPIIVVCPTTKFYRDNFAIRIYNEFNNIINIVKSKYEVQILNYYEYDCFTEDYFYDSSHLNIYGAEKFTKILQETIKW